MVKRAHGIASYREMFLDQKAQHKSYKKKKKAQRKWDEEWIICNRFPN